MRLEHRDSAPLPDLSSAYVNILLNGQPRQTPDQITIRRLLEELKLPARGIAVEVNEQIVPRDQHAEFVLRDGDRLEIVSLVGGG